MIKLIKKSRLQCLFLLLIIFILLTFYQSFIKSSLKINRATNFLSSNDALIKLTNYSKEKIYSNLVFDFSSNTSPDQISIDTQQEYVHLNFKPTTRFYWDNQFENKYFKIKKSKIFPLKVIVMPHSHNDPGWLKTFEEYYSLTTSNILDNMMEKLTSYSDLSFIWSEISFLSRHWKNLESHPEARIKIKELIDNGQLEIVSGGWVMTDEAVSDYYSMIDQLVEGHQWLRVNLNMTSPPMNSWSVDPFGHSSSWAYILSKSGIKNMVIQRIHYGLKEMLARRRALEFNWKQNFKSSIFCHVAPFDLYSIKHTCGPDPEICLQFDFRRIAGEYSESRAVNINNENVAAKAELLMEQYGRTASLFLHNVALIPLGDDFRYDQSAEWDQQRENFNLLMNYINSHKSKFDNASISFGTLKDYFREVKSRIKEYPQLTGDFHPYSDIYAQAEPSYWTGYYTTRPFWKSINRILSHYLRGAEILYTLARARAVYSKSEKFLKKFFEDYKSLTIARQSLDLFQHHDAITGTSKEFVMEEFGKGLRKGLLESFRVMTHSIQYLLGDRNESMMAPFLFPTIQQSNWDSLIEPVAVSVLEKVNRKLIVYNTHPRKIKGLMCIRVKNPNVRIKNAQTGEYLNSQINPIWNSSFVLDNENFELIFSSWLEPLSLTTLDLKVSSDKRIEKQLSSISLFFNDAVKNNPDKRIFIFSNLHKEDFMLKNSKINVIFDRHTGLLKAIKDSKGAIVQTRLQFFYYTSIDFSSGAYLFHPSNLDPIKIFNRFPLIRLVEGSLCSKLLVAYSNFLEVVFTVYHDDIHDYGLDVDVRLDMSIGNEFINREIIVRLETSIDNSYQNSHTFFTDSNGFQTIKRIWTSGAGIPGNFYPMTSHIFIEDNKNRLTVLSSHSHGVTGSCKGCIEVMLDRRIRYDDSRGLGEALLDNKNVISRFKIVLETIESNIEESTPNLSILLHNLWSVFVYPPIIFSNDGIDKRFLKNNLLFMKNSSSCMHLVNFRALPSQFDFSLPSFSSLLLLHNRKHTKRIKGLCKEQGIEFNNVNINEVIETSLTGLIKYKATTLNKMYTSPNEISAHIITYG